MLKLTAASSITPMKTRVPLAALLLAALAVLALLPSPAIATPAPPPRPLAEDFTGVDQYGREIRLSALKGKFVVLNFSAAWSGRSRAMAEDAQALTDLLRQHHVPFVYLTVLLQNAPRQIATAQTAVDWAAEHRITEPVLSPLGANTTTSSLWQQFYGYQGADTETAVNQDFFQIGWAFPYLVVIGPDQRVVTVNRGDLSPQAILTALGQGSLVYTAPAAQPAFGLDAFDLGFSSQVADLFDGHLVAGTAFAGSRAEPTAATGFTSGNLPATFTCDSSATSDTPFRATRTFTLENFDDLEGLGELHLKLTTSNLQWGAAGPGFLEAYAATVAVRDKETGETRRFPVPFVTEANGGVTVGPLQINQVNPDLTFAPFYDRLTFSLQWTRRADPLVSLLALENRLTALALPPGTESSLIGLLRRARLDTAPVAELHTLAGRLAALAGSIDAVQALQLSTQADAVRDLLIAHPPAPPPAVIRSVAATPASGHLASLFAVGRLAPDFSASSQQGPFRLGQLRGKWVVLDFCAFWCAPCNVMARNTPDVVATIKAQGIPFEYVTVLLEDDNHAPAHQIDAYQWAQDFGTRSPVVIPDGKSSSILFHQFNGYSLANPSRALDSGPATPTIVVIDPAGRIVSIDDGAAAPVEIFTRIRQSGLLLTSRPTFDLKNYEIDVVYGPDTATYNQASLSNIGATLSPDAGTASSSLNIRRTRSRNPNVVQENIVLGVNLDGANPTAIPHNIPLSLTLKQPSWDLAGPGFFLARSIFTTLHDDNTGDSDQFHNPLADPRFTGNPTDSFTSFDASGVPADFEVTSVEFLFFWLRQHPDCLVPYLLKHLPDLRLTAAQSSSLLVPLQAAARLFQLQNQPHAAVAKLQRFKALLLSLQSKSPDPQLAETMRTVTDTVIQQLNALP
jgi:peroxiredoxin